MIGQIKGILIEKHPPFILVDVGGVGYELQVPMSTVYNLPETGKQVCLKTHFAVREDAQLLFGFTSDAECSLFKTLIKINGVGPKVALAILSNLQPPEFAELIVQQDINPLKRVPGIGAKTAQRIIVEMQGRLPDNLGGLSGQTAGFSEVSLCAPKQEAISALISLGYKQKEAAKAVNGINDNNLDIEQLIKIALQGLAK